MANLKEGDLVHLKSGNTIMVIAQIANGKATCCWEDSKQKSHSADYELAILQKYEAPEPFEFQSSMQ